MPPTDIAFYLSAITAVSCGFIVVGGAVEYVVDWWRGRE